jgi:putative ABC transport system permease protein
MLKNQIKIAFRNLLRYRNYSAINIIGLTLGLCSVLLIVVYVAHELSYDRFHPEAERIYRVSETVPLGDNVKVIASTTAALAPQLRNDYPELENVTFFSRPQSTDIVYEEKKFFEDRIHLVDSEFFKVFSFEFLDGSVRSLETVNSIIISQSMAEKYFGDQDPMGKMLKLNQFYEGRDLNLEVNAVFKDMPVNSHFHMDFIVGMPTARPHVYRGMTRSWGWDSGYTYIKVPENYDLGAFDASMDDFIQRHVGQGTTWLTYFTRALTEIHLESRLNSELETNGNRQNIYVFSIIALAIIFIASVNYVNMATAIATRRSKEVGIMKTLGATRGQLVRQYISEALLVTAIATLLGGFLAEVLTPYFNNLAGKSIEIGFLQHPERIVLYVLVAMLIGLFSSIYPALYLSSFRSIHNLKSSGLGGKKGILTFRKGMLVVQFGISIFLIIGSIVVYNQWDYMRSKNYGLNTANTLTFSLQSSENQERFDLLKTALEQNPNISGITSSHRQIARDINQQTNITIYQPDSTAEEIMVSNLYVKTGFLQDMGVKLKNGRYFQQGPSSDTGRAIMMNEAAVKLLQDTNVIGRTYELFGTRGTVVGVTEDFHFESIYNTIKPLIFIPTEGANRFVTLKINSANMGETIRFIESAWTDFDPGRGFRYDIIGDDIRNLYEGEERFLNVFTVATGLAIFIACLGVFGLVSFSAFQRTKEIGIRKVLGAGTLNITMLLTKEFLVLIIIGNLIAWPAAYYFSNGWLSDYSYRIGFQWWLYVLAGGVALLIAIVTASTQTIKAARRNPVDSLRYE